MSRPPEARNAEPEFMDSRTMTYRREQDQALRRRLEQLESAQAGMVPPMMAPTESQNRGHVSSTSGRFYGQGYLLPITAFVAPLFGAAFMWLMMGGPAYKPGDLATASPIPAIQGDRPVSAPAVLSFNKSEAAADSVLVGASAAVDNREIQVRDLIEGWRQAWEQRDIEAYLGYYSQRFVPTNGQTYSSWTKARQQNLLGRSSIKVGIKDIRVVGVDVDRIKVNFLQDYASGKYKERAQPKTLMFERADNKWLISGEWQGE